MQQLVVLKDGPQLLDIQRRRGQSEDQGRVTYGGQEIEENAFSAVYRKFEILDHVNA
jgi:hypothetical protein